VNAAQRPQTESASAPSHPPPNSGQGVSGSGQPALASELTVSVVVPVKNGGAAFRRCLEALLAARPAPLEVIVVADGDCDGSADLAELLKVRVLRTAAQSGPAAARNLGAREAAGDLLFFVDADVVIDSAAIARIVCAFQEHPEAAAMIGSYDDEPAAPNFCSQYKNLLHHYTHQHGRVEASTFWTGCGAIRRDVFLRLKGFDETYRRPSVEDIELGYRLKAAGCRIRLDKALQGKHLKRWGAASLLRSDFFDRALPWTALLLKAGRFENDLNISRRNRICVIAVHALVLAVGLSLWWVGGLAAAALLGVLLLALDAPLLHFYAKKRGVGFALRVIPWHWLTYYASGLAFAFGLARHAFRRSARRVAVPSKLVPVEG
jgi:GT2 family glycosyltransferase